MVISKEAMPALEGRAAVVTGGARGIGRGIARALSCNGASVLIADVDLDAASDTAAALSSETGRPCLAIGVDLMESEDVKNMIGSAAIAFGRLDILINNARPFLNNGRFPDCMETWDVAMNVMVKAPAQAIASALEYFAQVGCGSVVNISSSNARHVSQQPLTYHLAKAAIVHLTRVLASELGDRKVRVNAVSPGLVDIEDRQRMLTSDPKNELITKTIVPLGRAATVDEIGQVVAFLCSDAATYVTGQNITVDGGSGLRDQFMCATDILEAFSEDWNQ